MNWPQFFLGCFVIGFVFSVMSFALGALGMHLHPHVPFVHHAHVPHASESAGSSVSPLNLATIMAFLAWFGGSGYLLTSRFGWVALPALAGAGISGIAGAAVVFWVMAHVLWSPHENMRSADTRIIGALGRVSQPIRPDGIGEVIYSTGGVRRSCGARSADGAAIEKGTEVVVTGYERGIASVRRWEDFAAEESVAR
jgi:membrane protein implicated in regulation of membrane protease activity